MSCCGKCLSKYVVNIVIIPYSEHLILNNNVKYLIEYEGFLFPSFLTDLDQFTDFVLQSTSMY